MAPTSLNLSTGMANELAPCTPPKCDMYEERVVRGYRVGRTLGRGSQGLVKAGYRLSDSREVALKFIDKSRLSEADLQMLTLEVKALKRVGDSKHVTALLAVEDNVPYPRRKRQGVSSCQAIPQHTQNSPDPRQCILLVLELCSGGDLLSFLMSPPATGGGGGGGLGEGASRSMFWQLLHALGTCHAAGVCHRDVKPENIVMDASRSHLSLTDFGLAAVLATPASEPAADSEAARTPPSSAAAAAAAVVGGGEEEKEEEKTSVAVAKPLVAPLLCSGCVGSTSYMAPEVCAGGDDAPYDGAKADLWSAGVVLFIMAVGHPPLGSTDMRAGKAGAIDWYFCALKRGLHGRFWEAHLRLLPPGAGISLPLRDLISRLLTADPDRRASLQEIYAHPWLLAGSASSSTSGSGGDDDGALRVPGARTKGSLNGLCGSVPPFTAD